MQRHVIIIYDAKYQIVLLILEFYIMEDRVDLQLDCKNRGPAMGHSREIAWISGFHFWESQICLTD